MQLVLRPATGGEMSCRQGFRPFVPIEMLLLLRLLVSIFCCLSMHMAIFSKKYDFTLHVLNFAEIGFHSIFLCKFASIKLCN